MKKNKNYNNNNDMILPNIIFPKVKSSQNILILGAVLTILAMCGVLYYSYIGKIDIQLQELRDFSNFAINIYFVIAALMLALSEISEKKNEEIKKDIFSILFQQVV